MKQKIFLLIRTVIFFIAILLIAHFIYAEKSIKLPDSKPCLSLTFDDSIENHFTEIFPILKERGHKATFFVIANLTYWHGDPIMTDAQLLELQNEGFEIGNHSLTHPFFTNLSKETAISELKESKSNLESRGLKITSFAFPFSNYNKEILAQANTYYEIVRDNYNLNSGGYVYNAQPVYSESNIKELCEKIKEAKTSNKWLIFVFHKVKTNPGYWDISKEEFINLLKCAEEKNLKINTLKECSLTSNEFNSIRFSPEILDIFYKTKPIGY